MKIEENKGQYDFKVLKRKFAKPEEDRVYLS
jgi:hypothetical protein